MVEIPSTVRGERQKVPLKSFITTFPSKGLKTITAGMAGEYVPLTYADTKQAEKIVERVKEMFRPHPSHLRRFKLPDCCASSQSPQGEGVDTSADDRNVSINDKKEDIHLPSLAEGWSSSFSGAFFTSHRMIDELTVVLFISLLLMYFILAAQFESFLQPLIVLAEIPIDLGFALVVMEICGVSLNLMSAIGIVVSCGIIINDSILKLDMINVLRKEGVPLMEAIHTAGTRRLRSIIMTSLTTILAMIPLLFTHDLGSELQTPLAIAMIATMSVGTLVSLFVIPLVYWGIYR
ncbi:MAG: efflux RND transporter permease subunit [Bacteroidaceae bacterium]|nr:efflux RND transporter permease subunit [Bacteroidaceae bacterium]